MSKTTIPLLILFLSVLVQNVFAQNTFDEFVDSFVQDPAVLTKEKHSGKFTTAELRILRNALYAKQGHIFKSSDLNKYFSSRTWYTPKSTATHLSESDESIVKLLHDFELIEKQKLNEFLDMFLETKLPITISNEDYGEQSSHDLSRELAEKYLKTPPCCQYRTITRFRLKNDLIALIYKTIYNADIYNLATMKPDGSIISKKSLSGFGWPMDSGNFHETSKTIINTNRSIIITDTGYQIEGEYKEENKKPYTQTRQLQIDRHGVISEL